MLLPSIWMLEAALPRTAEKAQLLMRLPRTITLPARNTLMALPYWPEPPARLSIASMRLSMTMVPSSPACERQTWMPLLPASKMRVARDQEAAAVERMDRDVGDVGEPVVGDLAVDRDAHDAVAAGADDLAIGDPDAAAVLELHEAAPLGQRPPAAVEDKARQADVVGARRPRAAGAPSVSTSRVAPRTPTICAPAASLTPPTR